MLILPILFITDNLVIFENHLTHNLNFLMQSLEININELSKKTGIRQTTMYKLKDGVISNPTIETLYPIAKYFNISIEELVGTKLYNMSLKEHVISYNLVPLIPFLEIGNFPNSKIIRNVSIDFSKTKGKFCTEVLNNDTEFESGTILIIDTTINYENKDYVIVKRRSDAVISIKRVLYDDSYALQSITIGLEKRLFDIEEYSIIGVVAGYLKNYKEAS